MMNLMKMITLHKLFHSIPLKKSMILRCASYNSLISNYISIAANMLNIISF